MKLSDFNYTFQEEIIAQHPLEDRTSSRMMVINRVLKNWKHDQLSNLTDHLKKGDVLVFNDSKVLPARIFGERSGGRKIEILLLDQIENSSKNKEQWRCMTKRVRNYRKGDKIFFGISATSTVVGREGDFLIIEFEKGHRKRAQERKGVPPLPPYIKRKDIADYTEEDKERYQTVYAKEEGSVAAPTAGLHFSKELLKKIGEKGAITTYVTLHVGADTFTPVRTENILEHKMHGEHFSISENTAEIINCAKQEKRRVIAVGTTTVRALESSAKQGLLTSGSKKTEIFISPGFKFQIVDAMLTNFHQPKSTLIMLVSAFADREFILSAYEDAIKNRYRLFSYGDCMLIV